MDSFSLLDAYRRRFLYCRFIFFQRFKRKVREGIHAEEIAA